MTKFTDTAAKDLGYVKSHWAWLAFAVGVVAGIALDIAARAVL